MAIPPPTAADMELDPVKMYCTLFGYSGVDNEVVESLLRRLIVAEAERGRYAKALDRIRSMTGVVIHEPGEADYGCGCTMHTAETAVAEVLRERDEALTAVRQVAEANAPTKEDLQRIRDYVGSLPGDNVMLRERVTELEAERDKYKKQASTSLANNLCPDHRDKQAGKPCLACEVEKLSRQRATLMQKLEIAESRLIFLNEKGITVGLTKTADKPEPYLAYVIRRGSELDDTAALDKLFAAEVERDAIQAKLSRYSMSAGDADQRRAESNAARRAFGWREDSESVSPSDITEKIDCLKNQLGEATAERDAIVGLLQTRLQPSGSPPPGNAVLLAEWITAEVLAELKQLRSLVKRAADRLDDDLHADWHADAAAIAPPPTWRDNA